MRFRKKDIKRKIQRSFTCKKEERERRRRRRRRKETERGKAQRERDDDDGIGRYQKKTESNIKSRFKQTEPNRLITGNFDRLV